MTNQKPPTAPAPPPVREIREDRSRPNTPKTESALPKSHNTARIPEDLFCRECGWPIISICCNDGHATTLPYSDWDWWQYCSNKTCVNHTGEGLFQDLPEFVVRKSI